MNCQKYGGRGVNIALHSKYYPAGVYWSPVVHGRGGSYSGGNSFVMVKESDPDRALFEHPEHGSVDLVSINGIGEVRWKIEPWDVRYDEHMSDEHRSAIKFFGALVREAAARAP